MDEKKNSSKQRTCEKKETDASELEWEPSFEFHESKPSRGMGSALKYGAAFVVPFLAVMLFPYEIPNKLLLGIIFSLLCALVIFGTLEKDEYELVFRMPHRRFALSFIYLTDILAVAAIGSITKTQSQVFYNSVPSQLIVYIAVALMTTLLPGLVVTELLSLRKRMDAFDQGILSVLLSIAITGLAGLASWNLASISTIGQSLLLTINFCLALIYTILILYNHAKSHSALSSDVYGIRISLLPFATISLVIIFICSAYFSIHSLSNPLLSLRPDELFHVGYTRQFLDNRFYWTYNLDEGLVSRSYPYLVHLYWAEGVALSGLPVEINHILSALSLIPLPVLAFFSLARSFLGDSRIAAITTFLFQISGGFGWILALAQLQALGEMGSILITSDLFCEIIYSTWFPTIVAPYLIDIAIFFFIIRLMRSQDCSSFELVALMIPLLVTSIIAHLEKTVILAGIGVLLLILQLADKTTHFRIEELGLSLALSSIIVLELEIITGKILFISLRLPETTIVIGAGILIYFISKAANQKPDTGSGDHRKSRLIEVIQWPLVIVLIFLIFLDLILSGHSAVGWSLVPFYLLPIKLGIAGVLAYSWFIIPSKENLASWPSISLLLISVVVIELVIYRIPGISSILGLVIDEFRYIRDILWPIICIVSGLFLKRVSEILREPKVRNRMSSKKGTLAATIILIILFSTSANSHFLKLEYSANTLPIAAGDEGVLASLSNLQLGRGAAIYVPASLAKSAYAVTGATIFTPSTPVYGEILSSSVDVSSVVQVLIYLNVSHVVLLKSAQEYSLRNVAKYAYLLYSDTRYDLYELRIASSPSTNGQTALVRNLPNFYPNSTPETPLHYGFNLYDAWQSSVSSNIIEGGMEIIQGTADLWAITEEGQKGTQFYEFNITTMIPEGTYWLWVRFRTQPGTKLLTGLIFDNGKLVQAVHRDSVLMESPFWAWSMTKVVLSNSSISRIQIGISNTKNEDVNELLAEVDEIVLTLESGLFVDVVSSLSVANINFTIQAMDTLNQRNIHTALILDQNYNFLVENNSEKLNLERLVIFGNLSESDLVSNYLNFSSTGSIVNVDKLRAGSTQIDIPITSVPEISIEEGEVLAFYGEDNQVPMIIKLPTTSDYEVLYVNIWPIFDTLVHDLAWHEMSLILDALKWVFIDLLSLDTAQELSRDFVIKLGGPIQGEGNISIICLDFAFFSNGSDFGEKAIGECKLEVLGKVEVNSLAYGYSSVHWEGTLNVIARNGTLLVQMQSGEGIASIQEVSGNGSLVLNYLSSSYPFSVRGSVDIYSVVGRYQLLISCISNELMVAKPILIPGFL